MVPIPDGHVLPNSKARIAGVVYSDSCPDIVNLFEVNDVMIGDKSIGGRDKSVFEVPAAFRQEKTKILGKAKGVTKGICETRWSES